MDVTHRFHTSQTFLLVRLEHMLVAAILAVLGLQRFHEIDWGRFAAAFLLIDAIGYIPGAIAYRQRGGRPIAPVYHHLYNITHNYLVAALAVGAWALVLGRLEWAMIAIPIHLSVDRGLFGNTYKPTSLPFEPQPAPGTVARAPVPADETSVPCAASAFIDHPSGYLALSPRNRVFTLDGLPGFVSYREQGRHWITLGGVHASPDARPMLLDAFVAAAHRMRRRPLAVQIRADQCELFRSRGFTVNQFGSTYALGLHGYSFAGTKKVKLRNKIKRARSAGLRVLEVGRDIPSDAATFASLDAISALWLKRKGKKEIDFMIGEMGEPSDPNRRIFVVVDATDSLIGFITYVPVYGARTGYLHDLTRRLPSAPPGAMELCNAEAIERLIADGVEYLHFGFTPFVTTGEDGPGANRIVSWVIRMLGRFGGAIYPARSQVEYKLKWGPDIVEPEFVAFRPLSLRAVFDLLRVTRSI